MEKAPAASRPSSTASLRWSILRGALLSGKHSQIGTKNISQKAAGGFNLIPCHPLHGDLDENLGRLLNGQGLAGPKDVYICYELPLERVLKLILIQRMEGSIGLNDFETSTRYDIDTTGLVCCWPTEDVLAYFCIKHANMFRSRRVLELGSGYGLAGLAVAASTDAYEVVISDGNPQVVDYIQHNINVNAGVFGDTKVKSWALHWDHEEASDVMDSFDIIIASDCTFFKKFHGTLARTVKSLLKCSETSEAIFLGPKRGDSLDKFLEKVTEIELGYELVENYDNRVWNAHQRLESGDADTCWPNYAKDHCYPLMVRIRLENPPEPPSHGTLQYHAS